MTALKDFFCEKLHERKDGRGIRPMLLNQSPTFAGRVCGQERPACIGQQSFQEAQHVTVVIQREGPQYRALLII